MTARRTPATAAAGQGVGLFTARPVMYSLRPIEEGKEGLIFRRVDLEEPAEIPARIEFLSGEPAHEALAGQPARCTILEREGARVIMTEHVLSALAGLGVTDAIIELNAPELPMFDGSASPYVVLMNSMGLRELPGEIKELRIRKPIVIRDGDATIKVEPRREPGCAITYELDYGMNPAIQPQSATWTTGDNYARVIAPARTFSLESEAGQMRDLGLFRHVTPRDLLVLGPFGPVDNRLRFDNEPARHKLLDLIGDLALVGRPVRANITATRSGHAMNHRLVRALLKAV